MIIQLGGYFSFISEYSRALSGVYKIAQLLPPKCTITSSEMGGNKYKQTLADFVYQLVLYLLVQKCKDLVPDRTNFDNCLIYHQHLVYDQFVQPKF